MSSDTFPTTDEPQTNSDETDLSEQRIAELADAVVEKLEERDETPETSRRGLLKRMAAGGAMAAVGFGGTQAAVEGSTEPAEAQSASGSVGTPDNPVDVHGDTLNANLVDTELEYFGKQSSTPTDSEIGSGNVALYFKTDDNLYKRPYGGSEIRVASDTSVWSDDDGDGIYTLESGSGISITDLTVSEGNGFLGIPAHHINYESGLSSEEVSRHQLQTGTKLDVWRLDVLMKGGGSTTDFVVEVFDVTTSTVLASTSAGATNEGGTSPLGSSGDGSTVILRVTNNTGSAQDVTITGVASITGV